MLTSFFAYFLLSFFFFRKMWDVLAGTTHLDSPYKLSILLKCKRPLNKSIEFTYQSTYYYLCVVVYYTYVYSYIIYVL